MGAALGAPSYRSPGASTYLGVGEVHEVAHATSWPHTN